MTTIASDFASHLCRSRLPRIALGVPCFLLRFKLSLPFARPTVSSLHGTSCQARQSRAAQANCPNLANRRRLLSLSMAAGPRTESPRSVIWRKQTARGLRKQNRDSQRRTATWEPSMTPFEVACGCGLLGQAVSRLRQRRQGRTRLGQAQHALFGKVPRR